MGRRMELGRAEREFSRSRPMATQDMELKEPSLGKKAVPFFFGKGQRLVLPQAMTSHSFHIDLKWLAFLIEQSGGVMSCSPRSGLCFRES